MASLSLNLENWRWDEVRERSEALFGSPNRLRVALLVSLADSEELYAGRIAEAAEIGRKEAVRELARFEDADLLVAVSSGSAPKRRGRPPRLLERRDTEAWAALQALGERFRESPSAAGSDP